MRNDGELTQCSPKADENKLEILERPKHVIKLLVQIIRRNIDDTFWINVTNVKNSFVSHTVEQFALIRFLLSILGTRLSTTVYSQRLPGSRHMYLLALIYLFTAGYIGTVIILVRLVQPRDNLEVR